MKLYLPWSSIQHLTPKPLRNSRARIHLSFALNLRHFTAEYKRIADLVSQVPRSFFSTATGKCDTTAP